MPKLIIKQKNTVFPKPATDFLVMESRKPSRTVCNDLFYCNSGKFTRQLFVFPGWMLVKAF